VNIGTYFNRVVLVNLKRRPDRLARALAALEACDWPFAVPEVFEAIDGQLTPAPEGWQSGAGAWGCLRSHQRILERAIQDGVDRLLVLEDDVCFSRNFATDVAAFLRSVPNDWDQLLIGGQHRLESGIPEPVNRYVLRCKSCERTHCYAIRGAFMRKAYQRLCGGGRFNAEVHCDWILARDPEMQRQHRVYAPTLFLAGQEEAHSDIGNRTTPRLFWNAPGPELPVVHLRSSHSLACVLSGFGFHFGHRGLDASYSTIQRILAAQDRSTIVKSLREFIIELQWEVASTEHLICALWHDGLSRELVQEASLWRVFTVGAQTVEEAVRQLPDSWRRSRAARGRGRVAGVE
jgi:hypothetical protein